MRSTSREQVKSINGTCVKRPHSISLIRSHGNSKSVRSGSSNGASSLISQQLMATISEGSSYTRLCSGAIRVAITLSILSLQASAANVLQYSNMAAITSPTLDSDTSIGQFGGLGRRQAPGDIIAIKEGQDLDLSCPIVVQNEDLIISWTCNNEPANIRSSRIHVTESGKLRIRSAKVGDSCNYRCEAADGFETFSVVIKVVIVDRLLMDQLTKRTDKFDNSTSRLTGSSNQQSITAKGASDYEQFSISQPDHNLGIEMQIEPSEVHTKKNKTFSLSCRIKHAQNLAAPQIIWLKEYLGGHVDSLNDVIEKNLILIDGVYYHSLNWPRALSYSKQSSTANSALLVKQTNWLHSGRYICFAGYPTSIMSLQVNNSLPNGLKNPFDQFHPSQPIRYKMARAVVTVDDREGEIAFRTSRSSGAEDPALTQVWTYICSNMTGLVLVLLMICTSLAMVKFVALTRHRNRKSLRKNMGSATSDNQSRNQTQGPTNSDQPVTICGGDTDYMPGFRQERFDLSHVPTNSLINDNNPLGERYKFDQALLSERLNHIDSTNGFSNNDHIYSEIGYRMAINSNEEPYYKQPSRINKQ